jgi:hypothetical protein
MLIKCPIFAFSFDEKKCCPTENCLYRTHNNENAHSSCLRLHYSDVDLFDSVSFPVLELLSNSANIKTQRIASIQLLSMVLKVLFIVYSDDFLEYTEQELCECGFELQSCSNFKDSDKCKNRVNILNWIINCISRGVNAQLLNRVEKKILRKIVLDVMDIQRKEIGNPLFIEKIFKKGKLYV